MDIKNALNAILPLNNRAKAEEGKPIKTGTSTDRDANGQATYDQSQNEQHREPMTEEQLQKALKAIREYPAVKEHNLTVDLVEQDGKKFVLLRESNGKLIRRIPEIELWTLPDMTEGDPKTRKGQLLRKTA